MNKEKISEAVERAKNGDKEAFEILYNEFHDKLYFFILKNVKNKEAAEDITQETFLKSMEKISTLEKTENYGTWLHNIAYNKCMDFFRSEKNKSYFDNDEEYETALEDVSLNEPVMLPDDYAINKERQNQLKAVIDELKPDVKSAIILYYYDNLSVKEVAKTLGIKENAAKQKLFAARKKIKQKIDKLVEKGAVLCAVPIGNMLENTISPEYAEASVSSSSAALSSSSLTAKVVGISAAAVIVVGIPVGLGVYKHNNMSNFGDYTDSSSSVVNNSEYVLDVSSSVNESAKEVITSSDSSEAKSVSVDSVQDSESNDPNANIKISSTKNNVQNESQADSRQDSDTDDSEGTVDITVDKLLSMTVKEALELGGNDYEMVYPTGVQEGTKNVYKCAKFPQYCFKEASGANPDDPNIMNEKIGFLNLYEGSYINDKVYVGMTYNELAEAIGEKPQVQMTGDDIGYASLITLDGRKWEIGYDITEEQKNEIWKRISEQAPDSESFELSPYSYSVTIEDINPTVRVAVYHGSNS